jgi:predicted TIM-barrel fold metal-dependent hydrolase
MLRFGYGGKSMARVLISPDSHIIERPELWVERLPEKFRDELPDEYRPRPARQNGGEAKALPRQSGASADRRSNTPIFGAGIDPNKRVGEMEQDGLTAEVLYCTKAMQMFHLEDEDLQEACFRAYNDELHEYCSVARDRIYGIGLISLYNIDHAIKELQRCRNAGMVGAMVWMTPHPDLPFSRSEHYERFWAAAQDLNMPVSLHINTGWDFISLTPHEKRGGAKGYVRAAVNERIELAADALLDLIFTGTFERYPRLKIVIAECEICWLPTYLQQWDFNIRRYSERGPVEPKMSLMPSEYFARQIYATFLEDEVGGHSLEWWKAGQENCMWSTDFPHSRTSWPHSRELLEKEIGFLPEPIIQKVVHDNAIRLYGLKIPEPVA